MSAPHLLLGLDISTTSAKAMLVDPQGRVVAAAATPLALSSPRPLWSEQDPHDWWAAAASSIQRALDLAGAGGGDVLAAGLSGQMHGLVLLDAECRVLRPAILWNDQRTAAQCDEIRARLGRSRLIELTGNDALAGFTAPKILWVREHEPEIYRRAAHVLLPKDYVRYRLGGVHAVDVADAAGTLLLDLRTRGWSAKVLEALDIPAGWLPRVYEGPEVTGTVSPEGAQATGLTAGTPLVAGAGDQAAQAVGVGAVEQGIVALTLGTSGVVFSTTDRPLFEPEGRLHAFCHALPGRWHVMGVMLSAAGSLRWFCDQLAPGVEIDTLLAAASEVPAGCEGLLFLPYLTGERTPHPDPLARGAFVGLTARHSRAHLTRAVLEGVAFGLRDSLELIRSSGLPAPTEVRLSGGGARSPVWRQILADVLGEELVTVNTAEGAAYGAALLAGIGAGVWPDGDTACRQVVRVTSACHPTPATSRAYDRLYPTYRELYPALRSIAHALSAGG